ncbi:MAG: NfeD family protein [Actinomycetota bacterium]
MRRSFPFLAALAVLACWPAAASATGSSTPAAAPSAGTTPTRVEVIKVEGPIDSTLLAYVNGKLDTAESEGAVVILQLNTAGALNQDGLALADRIAAMKVPVVTWTGPVPAKAAGAGVLLMGAATIATVAPGSQTGPLYPLDLAHADERPNLTGLFVKWAALHDRTAPDLSLIADKGIAAKPAIDAGFATFPTISVPDLLEKLDAGEGGPVQVDGHSYTFHTHVAKTDAQVAEGTVDIRFNNLGPIDRMLHWASSPSVIFLLLVLGLAGVAFELTQPGFGFAGFAGVGMLALAVFGLTVVPMSWLGFVMLLGGVGLLVADVRIRNLGLLSVFGLILFGVGSWLTWHGLGPAIRLSPWLLGSALIASVLYYGFGLTVALQSRDRIVTAQRGLIGLVGEARGKLSPEGPVYVKGTMWRGRTMSEPIPPGSKVRVRGIDGLVLKVEVEPGSVPGGPGPVVPGDEPAPVPDRG